MPRLVIVSNRVPPPNTGDDTAGGLAVALREILAERDVLWFGWSGKVGRSGEVETTHRGRSSFAVTDLTAEEHRGYYSGFCNGTLWPLLHYRPGLADFVRADEESWRAVNARFALLLRDMLRPDDVIWIQDFHLFPLAAALRRLGLTHRIGFFLHVPFPPPAVFDAMPRADAVLADLVAVDLIGVQTEPDARHLSAALHAVGVTTPVEAYPVGIDAPAFARAATRAARLKEVGRFRESLSDRGLILGADRLDYSKGLPQRLRGYANLLRRFPEHRGRVTFLQAAPVSRGEVAQYRMLRRELDELVGRVNGEYGEVDWIPVRWLTRPVPRRVLAGLMRRARIGLVTPLRDGMNLVAKEFVAAQNPADPGVLVLSRFAGAARELAGAVMVNPHDPEEIAETIDRALTMSLEERKQRWALDHAALMAAPPGAWADGFLRRLDAVCGRRSGRQPGTPRYSPATVRLLRVAAG